MKLLFDQNISSKILKGLPERRIVQKEKACQFGKPFLLM